MSRAQLLLSVLISIFTGCADAGGVEQADSPARDTAAASSPEPHPDDPVGWVPIETFQGETVEVHREYDAEGTLRRIACYLAGRVGEEEALHGPEWTLFATSFLREKVVFVHGTAQGEFLRWWLNGQLRWRGTYLDGERHGQYLVYYKGGDLRFDYVYERGLPTGTWREYYVGEVLQTETEYQNGKRHGRHRSWDRPRGDGTGVPTGGQGVLTIDSGFENGVRHGQHREFHPNTGELRVEGRVDQDRRVGTWRRYHPSGVLQLEQEFVEGVQQGTEIGYDADGNRLEVVEIVDGKRQGPARQWYADGTPQSEGSYLAGQRNGPWTYWKPDGIVNAAWSGTYEKDVRVGD